MTPATAADVRERIAAGRSDLVAATTRLVEIATENPPAAAYPECVSALVDLVEEAGLDAEVIELETPDGSPRAAVRSFVGEGPTLWFHGHYDVVPAQHAGQFAPDLRDGMLFGRGSADMKGGLTAMLLAARAIRDAGAPLNGRLGLLFVPDEETGGAGGSAALSRAGLLAADGIGMLSPEPTGGIAWNGCRGAISLRVTVKGTSAHVGLSHTGVNAFTHMLEVASALCDLAAEVGGRRTAYAIEPDAARSSILLLG
ncbi:MAG: M20/M25/M40 family metallo-hydrolase, partial [Gaiellales bacterium]